MKIRKNLKLLQSMSYFNKKTKVLLKPLSQTIYLLLMNKSLWDATHIKTKNIMK